jgi:uncharacterized membrane protein
MRRAIKISALPEGWKYEFQLYSTERVASLSLSIFTKYGASIDPMINLR